MSGSFQWPGPAYGAQRSCAKRSQRRCSANRCRSGPSHPRYRRSSASNWPGGPSMRLGQTGRHSRGCRRCRARLPQGLAHLFHVGQVVGIPVVFQIIESPGRPLAGVVGGERILAVPPALVIGLFLRPGPAGIVAGTARELGIGGDPGRRIDSRLQAHGVDLVAQPLHIGELLVGLDGVERAAAPALPGIVDIDVGPAVIDQPRVDHRPGRTKHFVLIDGLGPAVPTVPAQRRREANLLANDDAKGFLGRAAGILGPQDDLVDAGS